ncbi:hypothetical protein M8J77_009512 [Diaphorina citri]|nr:hypothetical protein M8J77_009512 [Diaphorina citri]
MRIGKGGESGVAEEEEKEEKEEEEEGLLISSNLSKVRNLAIYTILYFPFLWFDFRFSSQSRPTDMSINLVKEPTKEEKKKKKGEEEKKKEKKGKKTKKKKKEKKKKNEGS